jgi:hypothetical protein
MCNAIYPHKEVLCSQSIASEQFQLTFCFEIPGVNILWNNTDKLTGMEKKPLIIVNMHKDFSTQISFLTTVILFNYTIFFLLFLKSKAGSPS